MSKQGVLVLDHGTTGIKAVALGADGAIAGRASSQFEQIYPQPGWVEHNPVTLWELSLPLCQQALKAAGWQWHDVAAIGVTNQRETTILWDKVTGQPVYNAIVWQCRRTAAFTEALKAEGKGTIIAEKTGLVCDPYFSASKVRWILDNVVEAKTLLAENRLLFGTVDTWILWQLSAKRLHVTDPTNASRTMLFNIHQQCWDAELLGLFGVPENILPLVRPSNAIYGETDPALTGGIAIPLAGNAGDQQAALFGQRCWQPGTAKSTYGTGAFLMMNLGQAPVTSTRGLLTTLGCDAGGNPNYASEGAIFFAGATTEWLMRGLGLASSPQELSQLAESVPDTAGVYLVPAFAGLAAPYWDAGARGVMTGLTQGATKAHIARAAYESMAYQTREVLDAMQTEAGLSLEALRVDGGVTKSKVMVRFLADMLNTPVLRTEDADLTAKGAGYLAGLAVGLWPNTAAIGQLPEALETFEPAMTDSDRTVCYEGWLVAVQKALSAKPKAVMV